MMHGRCTAAVGTARDRPKHRSGVYPDQAAVDVAPAHMAGVREVSIQVVPSRQRKVTQNFFAATVPVASVPADLKFVPQVRTNELVPAVVMTNVTSLPIRFVVPVALKVQAPVGVIVNIEPVRAIDMAPVVAGAA